jgi:hypothetical protein
MIGATVGAQRVLPVERDRTGLRCAVKTQGGNKMNNDKNELHENNDETAAELRELPVGTHTIDVSTKVSAYFQSLESTSKINLNGTRVWMQRKNDTFLLHIGDVEVGTCDE